MKIYLASQSPRRRQLLGEMGVSFSVSSSDASEEVPEGTLPQDAVRILAERKCAAACPLAEGDALVIGADTLVALGEAALGKPRDEEDAVKMLLSLSGKTHQVYTGVCLARGERMLSAVEKTSVTFRAFDEREARAYVATGEPMDKAGAYGIQGLGGKLVSSIEGEFDNVVGFPTKTVRRLLGELS